MRILFVPATVIPLYHNIIEDRPLGGTETGVVRLASALADLGHEVTVITRHPNPPLSNPLYLPLHQADHFDQADVMVVVRDFTPFFWKVKAGKSFYWCGDSFDQPITIGLGDKRISDKIDGFLAVSKWHAESMCSASGFPKGKSFVLGNGVHLPYFSGGVTRHRKRLIYSSTPYRGLSHLLRLFPRIKSQVPQSELVVFSGLEVYAKQPGLVPDGYESEFKRLQNYKEQAEKMGAKFVGNIKQSELAKEFERAAILSYPNTFAETSCITILGAQAAGCVPVTSAFGALPETVASAGIVLEGTPGTESYDQLFVDNCIKLLDDDAHFESLSKLCKARRSQISWTNIAQRFLEIAGG